MVEPIAKIWLCAFRRSCFLVRPSQCNMVFRQGLNEHFIKGIQHQHPTCGIARFEILQSDAAPFCVPPITLQRPSPSNGGADPHFVFKEAIQDASLLGTTSSEAYTF